MCVYIYECVSVCVCMHGYMCIRDVTQFACMYVCKHACICSYRYKCMHTCMACMHGMWIYVYTHTHVHTFMHTSVDR